MAFEGYFCTGGFYGFPALLTAGKGGEQSELGVPSRVYQQGCPRALALGVPAQAGCSTPPVCERRPAAPDGLLQGDGPSHHTRHWHHIRFFPARRHACAAIGGAPTWHVFANVSLRGMIKGFIASQRKVSGPSAGGLLNPTLHLATEL